jgi:hypothetical protein
LQSAKPDVVVVAAGTRWTRTDPIALKQIFEGYKVIGMGNAADELFGRLDLQITNVMHSREGGLMVQDPALLAGPVAINAPDQSVDIFKSQVQGAAIGIYDKGSPDIAGFEGLARWQSFKNHWPIARQGNFLFWGFEGGTGQLSDNGKALFANLVVNHKSRPWTPLSKVTEESEARRKLEQVPPGISTGQLSAQVTKIVRRFSIKKPGPIEATLTWDSSDCALALILNGPGQRGYFARKDGASPLSLQFIVTEEQFAKGDDWSISVTCFRDLGPDPIKFSMKLDFPDTP